MTGLSAKQATGEAGERAVETWLARAQSDAIPVGTRREVWTRYHLIGAIVMTGLGLVVTREAWIDIANIMGRDEEASHIFLVPIVFAWLLWVRRERFGYCQPVGQAMGPVLVALGWAVSLIGYHNAVQSFWHGGAIVMTVGCVVSVVGREVVWRFLPAFAVLVFLVPVPGVLRQEISQPLQSGVASITAGVLKMLSVPAYQVGNTVHVNGKPVNIVEACNGMRMVFALVMVSYAFAFGTPLRAGVRAIILVASPLLAMACNIIRLIPTAWIYGYYDIPYEESFMSRIMPLDAEGVSVGEVFHDATGWGMLFVAFMLLMGIVRVLRWALVPVERYNLAYN